MALKTSKKSKKRPVREEFLYQPSLQLEPPPLALEKIYHRLLAQLARSIPMALALFIAMTVIEAQTHWLAGKTGREWLIQLSRLPSANSGQGNIGADSILAGLRRVKARFVPAA